MFVTNFGKDGLYSIGPETAAMQSSMWHSVHVPCNCTCCNFTFALQLAPMLHYTCSMWLWLFPDVYAKQIALYTATVVGGRYKS